MSSADVGLTSAEGVLAGGGGAVGGSPDVREVAAGDDEPAEPPGVGVGGAAEHATVSIARIAAASDRPTTQVLSPGSPRQGR